MILSCTVEKFIMPITLSEKISTKKISADNRLKLCSENFIAISTVCPLCKKNLTSDSKKITFISLNPHFRLSVSLIRYLIAENREIQEIFINLTSDTSTLNPRNKYLLIYTEAALQPKIIFTGVNNSAFLDDECYNSLFPKLRSKIHEYDNTVERKKQERDLIQQRYKELLEEQMSALGLNQ